MWHLFRYYLLLCSLRIGTSQIASSVTSDSVKCWQIAFVLIQTAYCYGARTSLISHFLSRLRIQILHFVQHIRATTALADSQEARQILFDL